jgi:hypothetical protein
MIRGQQNIKFAHLELNTTIELKSETTTCDNNSVYRGMFQLTNVLVLSDVDIIVFSSIVLLTLNGNFWIVQL